MKEITKQEFKKLFYKYATPESGWSRSAWRKSFGRDLGYEMKYKFEEPPSPAHDRLYIVTDSGAREHRMFFMTDEADEAFYDNSAHD